jgi:hypothetical protein
MQRQALHDMLQSKGEMLLLWDRDSHATGDFNKGAGAYFYIYWLNICETQGWKIIVTRAGLKLGRSMVALAFYKLL